MQKHRLYKGIAGSLLALVASWAYAAQPEHHDTHAAATSPTGILSHEHRVVERMVDVLVAMADEAEKDGRLDVAAAGEAVDFLKGFVDACHHAKEEQLLFPALDKQGTDAARLKALKKEHDEGRAHVKAMAKALESADAAAAQSFAKHARAYAALLRKHIETEDKKLFPEADKTLTHEAQAKLAEGFERVEAEETGEGVHEKYLGIAERLEARYGKAPHADEHAHQH